MSAEITVDGQTWRVVGTGTERIDRGYSRPIARWRTECRSCRQPFEVWAKGRRVGERKIVHWCSRHGARARKIMRPLFEDEMGIFGPEALDS